MRFPLPNDALSSQLAEFDIWITPSLGEIVETDRYQDELNLATLAFDTIGQATKQFDSIEKCRPRAIAEALSEIIRPKTINERKRILRSLASALFVVTGKSDNNFKCQFPLFLRDEANWRSFPMLRRRDGRIEIRHAQLPRTLTSARLMSIISQIDDLAVESSLLSQFLSFLLKDQNAVNQFWALGHSYFALKKIGRARDLLAPIVIFKVRGSVMASGGHEPERMLRQLMREWGLEPDVDFNASDVIVVDSDHDPGAKTRAYDFVIPYKTPGWPEGWSNRLFIQCQFYAGDSGSVSHKNVDQTRSSRDSVSRFVDAPIFVEYVDGAGYFSALNGDLRRLLSYEDTHGLLQIRTAPVRLRCYFEKIGFIPPIKIEESIALGISNLNQLRELLRDEGYPENEISRSIDRSIKDGHIAESQNDISITPPRMDVVRRYLLLNIAANYSAEIRSDQLAGKILLPGYGPFFGISLDQLADSAIERSPVFKDSYASSSRFLSDLRWLSEKGYVLGR